MKDGSAEGGDGEAEVDSDLGEPPEKKRCLEKENVMTSSTKKKREAKEASERSTAGKIIEMM